MASLMFWREAAGGLSEQNTSVVRRRFIQPWTFALLATVCLLLAATMADWQAQSTSKRAVVIDIDESLTWPDANGRSLLENVADDAFSSPAVFIAAGDTPLVLGTTSDTLVAVRQQFEIARTNLAAKANASAAIVAAGSLLGDESGAASIDWYTSQPAVPIDVSPRIAKRVRIHRRVAPHGSAAVTGVTFDTQLPGGGFRFHVARSDAQFGMPLTLRVSTLAGIREMPIHFVDSDLEADASIDGLPPDGSAITATLGNGAAVFQTIHLHLPASPTVSVVTVGDVPPPLKAIATVASHGEQANRHLAIVDDTADAPPGTDGVIRIVRTGPANATTQPITGAAGNTITTDLDFESAVAGQGVALSAEAHSPLVQAGADVLASYDAAKKTVYLSTALVGDGAELTKRPAFPVFMARIFTLLAGRSELPPVTPAARLIADPLWPSIGGPAIGVSDRPTARSATQPPNYAATPPRPNARFPWTTTAIVLAMGLLTLEGILFAFGKVR